MNKNLSSFSTIQQLPQCPCLCYCIVSAVGMNNKLSRCSQKETLELQLSSESGVRPPAELCGDILSWHPDHGQCCTQPTEVAAILNCAVKLSCFSLLCNEMKATCVQMGCIFGGKAALWKVTSQVSQLLNGNILLNTALLRIIRRAPDMFRLCIYLISHILWLVLPWVGRIAQLYIIHILP